MLTIKEKKYLGDVFHYVGIGFIGGAVSHGFFSGTKSLIMASIGLVFFVIGEFLQKEDNKDIAYLRILLLGALYSLSIGMINGGLQHFLDSPERSLWIIPLGFFASIFVFGVRESMLWKEYNKTFYKLLFFGFIVSSLVVVSYIFLPKDIYSSLSGHHHSTNTYQENTVNIGESEAYDDIEIGTGDVIDEGSVGGELEEGEQHHGDNHYGDNH